MNRLTTINTWLARNAPQGQTPQYRYLLIQEVCRRGDIGRYHGEAGLPSSKHSQRIANEWVLRPSTIETAHNAVLAAEASKEKAA
jgi:hypothetical protein